MNARRPSALVLLIVLWGATLSACVRTGLPPARPGAEVGRGNALFDQQDYAAALEAYTAAAAQLPDAPEVAYNQGVTHYALGDYGEAERLFRQVDRTAQDLELVAAARYNLGNSKFQQGMAQRESNVQQALSALQASVAFYQGALELTPDDREAARNIEVVRLAIKDILDQLQDQRQEQQAQNELAEQLRDLQQRQEEAATRSAQLANEPPPESALSEALRQLREEQQQISEETAAAAQRLDEQAGAAQPSGTPSPSSTPEAGDERRQEALQKLQDAQSQQGQAADRLEGQEPQSAASHQRAAAEDIAEALRTLHDPNGAGTAGAPQAQGQEQEVEAQGAQDQPEQSVSDTLAQDQQPQDATAAQILDKERRDRAAREQLQRGTLPRTPPVEKNW
ncbi:MAG: tetratricopeptide repeat protein [Chloroflexota bacterium]|nr:tetratricopeptide repeat protein [Chloroflexota bacterium]